MTTLTLTETEKKSIKDMMAEENRRMAEIFQEQCDMLYATAITEIDEDTPLEIDMKCHKHLTRLSIHLINPKLIEYTPRMFWECETSVRKFICDALYNFLEDGTDGTDLGKKIENYLNAFY